MRGYKTMSYPYSYPSPQPSPGGRGSFTKCLISNIPGSRTAYFPESFVYLHDDSLYVVRLFSCQNWRFGAIYSRQNLMGSEEELGSRPTGEATREHNVFCKLGFSTAFEFGRKTQQTLEKILIALKLHGARKSRFSQEFGTKASVACAVRTRREGGLLRNSVSMVLKICWAF